MHNEESAHSVVGVLDEIDFRTDLSYENEFMRRPSPSLPRDGERSDASIGRTITTSVSATNSKPQEFQAPSTPLVRLPPRSLPQVNVQVLQQWEGIVTESGSESFCAELKDLSEPDYPLELVELPIEEIHIDDRPLIRAGACFYWSIGIKTSQRGVITRVSEIRFQRLPKWTRRKIEAAKKEAEKAFGSFWLAESSSAE